MGEGSMLPRVLLLHNFLTPYRVPLFNELAGRFDLDVWFLGDVRGIRDWPADAPQAAFRYRVLPHLSLPAGSRDYRVVLNPTLPGALARRRPQVLLCCGWDAPAAIYAGFAARRLGAAFVLWSGSTHGEPNWRRSLSRPLVRGLVRRADAWLAYGTRAKAYLVSLGAEADRVFCAYNTVETESFAAASALDRAERARVKRELGVGDGRVVLYCGQLIDRKGLADLLPAFAALAREQPDVTLLVAGSGNREARFRAWVRDHGLDGRVRFAGFVPRDALPRYYAAADLLALPSREEVWGLVINEALACGVPVLTTDAAGATADLMCHGVNGYVVPPGAPAGIEAALRRHFSADPAPMRAAARRSVEPFTIARAADAFEAAVRCALDRSGGGHRPSAAS